MFGQEITDLWRYFEAQVLRLKGESSYLFCIDNIESCAANSAWEIALFNFYNRHRENNHQLIVSADCPSAYLAIELADLKTRMNWGLTLKDNQLVIIFPMSIIEIK
jgi:chromosomal replication initiation ATPase DnaA